MFEQKQKTKNKSESTEAQIPKSIPVIDDGDLTSRPAEAATEEGTDFEAMDDGSSMGDTGECGCF